jgi:hypothetical protein
MADQARITSLDEIEAFRAALIIFIDKARRSLDEVADDVKRTRQWLQVEQPAFWAQQLRMRQKKLDQAQQELMSARMSEFIDSPTVQQMAVRKARQQMEDAQQMMDRVKAWNRDYDRLVDPQAKKLETMRDYLEHDLTQAVAYLVEIQKILDSYRETPAAPAASAPES